MMIMETTAAKTFTLTPLPYAYDALEPEISEETLRFHHDKHHAAYVAKLNELVAGTLYADMPLDEVVRHSDGAVYDNAAQAWNHTFYFETLSPTPARHPDGALDEAVKRDFGSLDELKKQMIAACTSLFGSGWVWLVSDDDGALSIVKGRNAENPMSRGLTPLVGIDVWEHAYYIDFRNARADSVEALWQHIDWAKVSERYER